MRRDTITMEAEIKELEAKVTFLKSKLIFAKEQLCDLAYAPRLDFPICHECENFKQQAHEALSKLNEKEGVTK